MVMAESTKSRIINLLPRDRETVLNQFLSWALTIGRLLVIITETLALSVFVYRFAIDVQIIDLHDKIKAESNIIFNFKAGEDMFRNLHERLAFAKEYDSSKDKELEIMKAVVTMGSGKVTFKSLIVDNEGVEIEAQAPSAAILSLFTSSLNHYPDLTNVSVNRVENRTSSALVTVSISADITGVKQTKQK